jgi:hypothetical protein
MRTYEVKFRPSVANGEWSISIRNERNETGRLFFTEDLKYLRAEKHPNGEKAKDH